ncbi:hypothetical protein PIB30_107656, partial [Stylosanthes scabra]|nr:hypothetical protein [Stylosanthes scabra]
LTEELMLLDMAEDYLNHAMDLSELLLLVEDCLQLLIESNRIPEAALLSRSYLPSKVSEIVAIWRKDLNKVNPKAAGWSPASSTGCLQCQSTILVPVQKAHLCRHHQDFNHWSFHSKALMLLNCLK